MPHTALFPEKELYPNRLRWTVDDCYRLADSGVLSGRYELIDGEIIEKMGQKPPHRITIMLIGEWLRRIFGDRYVQDEKPIAIPGEEGKYTEPEPDLAVTEQPGEEYVNSHPGPSDIVVAIEVSDTTNAFDLNVKALIYARAGIREYWVVDVVNRCVHIHLHPTTTGYGHIELHSDDTEVMLADRPESKITLNALLPSRAPCT